MRGCGAAAWRTMRPIVGSPSSKCPGGPSHMISRSRWYYAFLVITTAGFLVLAYGAYRTFNCRWSEDVGLFNQLCYSIVTDFSFGASIYHLRNCLAEQHFTPIYILFAPLYYFFRSSFTLIALSVLFT